MYCTMLETTLQLQQGLSAAQAVQNYLSQDLITFTALHQALPTAFTNQDTSHGRENARRALHKLGELNLVVEASTTTGTTLAHFIASSILNFSIQPANPAQRSQFNLNFPASTTFAPFSIQIPGRSHLILHYLALHLNLDIYLFSSRAKARRFRSPGANFSIGFFHQIDSYFQTSEYLVLTIAQQPLPGPQALPVAAPQPPTDGSPAATFRTGRRTLKRKRDGDGDGDGGEEKAIREDAVKRAW